MHPSSWPAAHEKGCDAGEVKRLKDGDRKGVVSLTSSGSMERRVTSLSAPDIRYYVPTSLARLQLQGRLYTPSCASAAT